MRNAILLLSCADQRGITASVTDFIYKNNGNIVHADQHIDEQSQTLLMRVEWDLEGFAVSKPKIAAAFRPLAEKFQMAWDLSFNDQRPGVAIFVSKHLHCLYDLLFRYKGGHLPCDIRVIISNHPDAKDIARQMKIRFVHTPVTPANKAKQEAKQRHILEEEKVDLVVLARYHQILSGSFVQARANRIINIHHSFLPAFAGKNPYGQAYQKGVKIIGATSHYVTEELDQGPIIEQDTVRISHRDSLEDLIRKGEDLEKVVLSRAVRLFLQKKILSYGNKTVVFD